MKLVLAEMVRLTVIWEDYGAENSRGKKVRKIVRLHDVTRTNRVLIGYAFIDGKKYRVVCPQRPGWTVGVATRVSHGGNSYADLESDDLGADAQGSVD